MNAETAVIKAEIVPSPSASHASRLVAAFLSGRNARTLDAYRQDLEDFREFTETDTLAAAAGLLLGRGLGEANALALAYRSAMLERGLSPATVNRHLAALRSLVKLARTLGMVPWTLEVQNVRTEPYRDTRGPGSEGFRRMLESLEGRQDAKSRRDRVILRLLYDLGLRRGEVVSLDGEDVLAEGFLAVLGKGRTEKVKLTLPPETQEALVEWLSVRGNAPGPLFVNFDRAGKSGRLTGRGLYHVVKRLGKAVGVDVRPQGLRHAAITEALNLTNGNVRAVQRFSRHKALQVLTLYDDNRLDLGGEVARKVAKGKDSSTL